MMPTLDELRLEIESIDAEIIEKIAARFFLVKKIGELKNERGQAVFDPTREEKLRQHYQRLSQKYQLDAAFIQQLFDMIFSHSRQLQE
jgi:chorismate mutase